MADKLSRSPKKQARPSISSDSYQRRMSPSARVSLAADLSTVATEIMMDNIRHRHPGISTEKLIEKARKRLFRSSSLEEPYKHIEDIRAILANTRVNIPQLLKLAKEQGTEDILRGILKNKVLPPSLKARNWETVMSETEGSWAKHPVFGKMKNSVEIVRFLRYKQVENRR